MRRNSTNRHKAAAAALRWAVEAIVSAALLAGCGSIQKKQSQRFFTSGSHEADQRAEQTIAKAQQLQGTAQGNPNPAGGVGTANETSLYQRLGGQASIEAIVNDFVPRVLADPRVNWTRAGVRTGGFLGLGGYSAEWPATPHNVSALKLHLAQFIALASGGPATYQGRDFRAVHHGMKISNAEFDASVGDLKATLDKLKVPVAEQKELLAIVESTRQEIVERR